VAAHGWRGLHVDLARQFLPAADVEWLVDVAAWHGLNRLHLHLTDDEAWRFPVPGFERLTDIGAWRGRGLAVPPLLGSGARPYGGSYDRAAIAAWHVRAEAAGIVIVPEVDLPGHCFAALAALPDLLDPDDTSAAVSVQHFVDDVLNPGVPGTWPFLEAVFGALADAFPSPWLHLGCDEVAPGAWSGSPAARAWGIARGVDGSHAIEQTFLREVIGLVRRTTGRRIGVWEEAAGAVERDDGYVVAWTSGEVARRLAGEGHDVVAAPAQHCYLDMAASADWHEPGASWAGHTSVADIEAFDPAAGWSVAEREHLLGVQACLWTEHVRDRPTMERLLFPRLTAFADAAWPGPERRV
jgi:hexosaminidase